MNTLRARRDEDILYPTSDILHPIHQHPPSSSLMSAVTYVPFRVSVCMCVCECVSVSVCVRVHVFVFVCVSLSMPLSLFDCFSPPLSVVVRASVYIKPGRRYAHTHPHTHARLNSNPVLAALGPPYMSLMLLYTRWECAACVGVEAFMLHVALHSHTHTHERTHTHTHTYPPLPPTIRPQTNHPTYKHSETTTAYTHTQTHHTYKV